MNLAVSLAALVLGIRLVMARERPWMATYLISMCLTYAVYDPRNVRTWLIAAALNDLVGSAMVLEFWWLLARYLDRKGRILSALIGLLCAAALISSANFDSRFGSGIHWHLLVRVGWGGFMLGTLMLGWTWALGLEAFHWITGAFFFISAVGPVSQYFLTKTTYQTAIQTFLALKLACLLGWILTNDYLLVRTITRKVIIATQTAVMEALLSILWSIATIGLPKR